MRTRRLSLALPLLAFLPGCGFQPAGGLAPGDGQAGDGRAVALRAHGDTGRLVAELRRQAAGEGVRIVPRHETGALLLELRAARLDRHILAVSPRSGQAVEYRLEYAVDILLRGPDGAPRVPWERLRIADDYVFAEQAGALGQPGDEELLHAELVRRTARRILRRLHAVSLLHR